ncbi:MAG TPA: SDR family oxidoreductase [Alphaproteobacteria bacterium]|nr:SDR family oxidoreductase [Alphaproteobacteria bacterium]
MPENTPLKGDLMRGKRGLVLGVANDRSIAYGISQVAAAQGADLAITYQAEPLAKRVIPLAEGLGAGIIQQADLQNEESMDALFKAIEEKWGGLDFVVHCVAFSDKAELDGQYVNTSRANFLNSMDISCFSFTSLCRRAVPLMKNGGSMLTLSYIGAERVVPHYNVMGVAKAALEASVRYLAVDLGSKNIRVNAISAGPIKTLAASGIGDFRYILRWNEINSPLGRNVTQIEVGNMALFLLSDMGTGVTGEVVHVDSGYHTVGMVNVDGLNELGELLDNMKATKAAAS